MSRRDHKNNHDRSVRVVRTVGHPSGASVTGADDHRETARESTDAIAPDPPRKPGNATTAAGRTSGTIATRARSGMRYLPSRRECKMTTSPSRLRSDDASAADALRIAFYGAAGTVTGSRFLVSHEGRRLLVDCGVFQGLKELRERNWRPFPVDPASIDAVVLTHAHIDHSGYLPALVRDGFGGDVWCTPATAALARVLLLDSAHLHEEDARVANRRRSTRHDPALPLYTTADAEAALRRLRPAPFEEPFTPVGALRARFSRVGHILGAAAVHLATGDATVTFTGDVGRTGDPVLLDPEPPPTADHLVTESTYGNRLHPPDNPADVLADIVTRTAKRGGTVLIPAFAVGRAQTLLHLLSELRRAGRIPDLPTFLNSPMAIDATELFCEFKGEHRLTDAECKQMCDGVTFVRSVEESKKLTRRRGPMIVLAGSGMATGGRILHHLESVAPDHRSTIVLAGFQAAGTRGEALANGARDIKVFGQYVTVRATVERIDSLSAHADADELVAWLGSASRAPASVSIVHGEPSAADALRRRLHDDLGWRATVANDRSTVVVAHTAAEVPG